MFEFILGILFCAALTLLIAAALLDHGRLLLRTAGDAHDRDVRAERRALRAANGQMRRGLVVGTYNPGFSRAPFASSVDSLAGSRRGVAVDTPNTRAELNRKAGGSTEGTSTTGGAS